jgi:2-phosphosulfolactate phosphatase
MPHPSFTVHFGSGSLRRADTAGRVVVVIDVLRASTTIATALANGATAVWPTAEPADARRLARRLGRGETLLGGERHAVRIPGFDLGNSPLEYTRRVVAGKAVVTTTTNGTRALIAANRGAARVLVGSFVNGSAIAAELRAALHAGRSVAIVCAGSDGMFSLEDAVCAGRFVRTVMSGRGAPLANLDDGATAARRLEQPYRRSIARLFRDARHGETLRRGGFARDLAACRALDRHPIVPELRTGRLVLAGP